MNKNQKIIEVVAAVIINGGRVFATQRGYGQWKDWWEFPGGKVEAGETHSQALRREIREELNTDIRVGPLLGTASSPPSANTPHSAGSVNSANTPHSAGSANSASSVQVEDIATPALIIYFYQCEVVSGSLDLLEAEASGWFTPQELSSLHWLPNDRHFVEQDLPKTLRQT